MKKILFIAISMLLSLGTLSFGQEPDPVRSAGEKEAEKQARMEYLEQEQQAREQERQAREQERDSRAQILDEKDLKELQREMQYNYQVFSEDMKDTWVNVKASMPSMDEIDDMIIMTNDKIFFQQSQSRLTLRNSFNGGSESTEGDFEVEESTVRLKFTISGKVREGEISITLYYPNGKVFKDFNIDSSAEITYSQSISFQEDNADKYIGTWEYEIEADEAVGNYMLSVSTN